MSRYKVLSKLFSLSPSALLFLTLLLGPLSLVAPGQSASATLSGVVADSSGAAISAATVVVRSLESGSVRTLKTSNAGFYEAPNLAAGRYSVEATAPGFSTALTPNLELLVGQSRTLSPILKPGQATETLTVSADAAQVDAETSTVGGSVDSRSIVELPLNGRDWTSLALLEPGVAAVRTQASPGINNTRDNRGLGNQLTVAGNRPQQNNYRLDGVSINDYSNGAPGSILGVDLGVESIREFSVITSNADASYGKTSGGVINAISRSGTNQFHGSAFEFIRNSAADARNFFDGSRIPSFKRNQFGGSIGGPILRDRTFFFGSYEGIRQSLGVTFNNTAVPTATARLGSLCPTNSGCVAQQVVVDPKVAKFLALYPLPNGAIAASGNTGTYTFAGSQVGNEDFYTVRADHKLTQSDTLFATYLHDAGKLTGPDTFGSKLIGTISGRQLGTLEDTHVFSASLLNSARFGYSRVVSQAPLTLSATNPLAGDTSLGAIAGRAAPVVNVSGLSQYPGGLGSVGEFDYHYNSYQAYDDVFITRSSHAIKIGFAFERMQNNGLGALNPNGNFTFPDLTSLLTNKPSLFTSPIGSIGVGLTPRDLRQSIIGGYLQDDWHARRNLTLNLGVRYELATVPTESRGKIATLLTATDAAPHLGSPLFQNPTFKNFAPRVGFGWSPFQNGKTAVRGGFGVYDSLPLLYLFQVASETAGPFYKTGSSNNAVALAGSFPDGAYAQVAAAAALNYEHIQQNPKRNYIMEWNLSVQQEMPGSVIMTLGYVGSHGLHHPGQWDENIVLPVLTPQGYMGAPAGTASLNPNTNIGAVTGIQWNGRSSYNGLNLRVKKQLTHAFQLQGSYTWQKGLDAGSATISGDTFLNSIVNQPFYFDPKVRHGLADFNVGQTLVTNGLWQVAGERNAGALLKGVTTGWQLGGIFQASTGTPFTATVSGDPMGIKPHAGDTYDIANAVTGPGCGSRVGLTRHPGANPTYIKTPCFAFPGRYLGNAGRNALIGPGLYSLDMSLLKDTHFSLFSKEITGQLRAEAFNVTNHTNFAIPTGSNGGDRVLFTQTGAPNATAGQITTTSTTARQLQLAVRITF